MNRELLQQALDALLHSDSPSQKRADAITALKQALAAPQPEPVAWRVPVANAEAGKIGHIYAEQRELVSYFGRPIEPLYAAPPAAPAPAVPDGAVLYCGHPASLAVKSAETGKTLYCDLCDAKSGRRDAEQMEAELREENLRLREAAKSVAPAAPDLKHKPTVQRLMDLARKFRATPGDLYDGAYKELQSACYEALSAAPVVREPQDERAAFEAWHSEYRGLVPPRRDDSYFDTHARLRWEGWQARAHGIGGGGK